jgi:fructose-1,6-bisphosphatase/inositol monophosphatase family enzyme
MQIRSIENVLQEVTVAGQMALEAQRAFRFAERSLKSDGSVLTETDQRVERYLSERLARAYPDTNILGEENVWSFDPDRPYTFVIDPIDGTDAFSQGMHGWSVSVGLLDRALRPIAGVVFAPKLELLMFADVGESATLNGAPVRTPAGPVSLSRTSNVMAYSKVHQQVALSRYPGKVRSIGSAALHVCFTLIYPGVFAAIEGRSVHIWDIAGAHAIVGAHGFALETLGGGALDYGTMVDGSPAGDPVVAGRPAHIQALRAVLAQSQASG